MRWFPVARVGVLIVLVTGMYLHLSRLLFGIDLTLERLVTTEFDSAFAVALIVVTAAIVMARNEVTPRNRLERFLFSFTLIYMGISIPVHVRTWFVPDNPEILRWFPAWYSVLFLCYTALMAIGWWNLRGQREAMAT
jgi:hypothetical protein